MDLNFYYSFPAIKGRQAQREYFIIMCPLNILSKLFIFTDEDIPAEYRAQRILNKNRIPDITEYILNNPRDYVFSSITASVDGEFEFIPLNDKLSKDIGILKISMDSRLLINDGQHRRAAIEEALKANPDLANETISVVLFIDEGLKRSQQIFADLNKHAVNVSKSIGILYDSRDDLAILTKSLIEENDFLRRFTDLENSSLPKFSPKLFTLSNIYKTNKNIVGKEKVRDERIRSFIFDYWDFLTKNISEWQLVSTKQLVAHTLRDNFINSHGVVLEALGLLGNYLYHNNYNDWKNILKNINSIDWNRNNLKDWSRRAIGVNKRIVKSSMCVRLTNNLIKQKLGIALSKEEIKLENELRKELET